MSTAFIVSKDSFREAFMKSRIVGFIKMQSTVSRYLPRIVLKTFGINRMQNGLSPQNPQTREDAPVLVAGHSHTHCMGLRRQNGDEQIVLMKLTDGPPIVYGLSMSWPYPENYNEIVRDRSAGMRLMLMWLGNAHMSHFTFAQKRRFDFVSSVLPSLPLDTDADIVPESLVETRLAAHTQDLSEALKLIMGGAAVSVTLVGTPPPKGDDVWLREMLKSDPVFTGYARQLGFEPDTVPFNSPHLRLKLWALIQRMTEQVARTHDIAFLPVPPESQDAEGFLKPEYWANDITHANASYGSLVVKHIQRASIERVQRA